MRHTMLASPGYEAVVQFAAVTWQFPRLCLDARWPGNLERGQLVQGPLLGSLLMEAARRGAAQTMPMRPVAEARWQHESPLPMGKSLLYECVPRHGESSGWMEVVGATTDGERIISGSVRFQGMHA